MENVKKYIIIGIGLVIGAILGISEIQNPVVTFDKVAWASDLSKVEMKVNRTTLMVLQERLTRLNKEKRLIEDQIEESQLFGKNTSTLEDILEKKIENILDLKEQIKKQKEELEK